jgi:hypothetical protein
MRERERERERESERASERERERETERGGGYDGHPGDVTSIINAQEKKKNKKEKPLNCDIRRGDLDNQLHAVVPGHHRLTHPSLREERERACVYARESERQSETEKGTDRQRDRVSERRCMRKRDRKR